MKTVELKVQWNEFDGTYNIYQNVNTFWKCFELWIRKEKLTNDFLKTYISEVNKRFTYTHYNIGINMDFIISELSFIFDDYFERLKKKFVWRTYWNTFPEYVKSLEKVYPFVKENLLAIYKKTTFLKNYWGYHCPNDIHGRSNNPDVAKTIRGNFQSYIDDIQGENQESRIFGSIWVEFKDEIAPIFPWELSFDKKNKGTIPIKFIDDSVGKKLDELVDSTYEYFIKNDIVEFIDTVQEQAEKKESWINSFLSEKNWEEKAKDVFMDYFLRYNKQLLDYVLDNYFKKSSIYGLDYYLYENQYFLDLTDIIFIGERNERIKWRFMLKNRFSLEMLNQMLIDGLKDWFYDHYVLKVTYFFDAENWESYQITPKWEGIYTFYDGKETHEIQLDEEEVKLLEETGTLGTKKIRWWITLWLYTKKLSKIKEFKLLIAKKFRVSGYKLYFQKWGWANIFEHNNYLFQTNMVKAHTTLTPAFNIKRFFEIMPSNIDISEDWMYLWIDWYSKQPIIKQPFQWIDEAKNMALMWKSGSWKTLFSQQLVCTNIRDKLFIVDPVGTFSGLKNITDCIQVVDIFEMDYNPIAIDKELYKKWWANYFEWRNEKIEVVKLILNPASINPSLVDGSDFMTILNIFLIWIYDHFDTVTIDLIYNEFVKLIETKKLPDYVDLWREEDRNLDQRSISIYSALTRKLIELKQKQGMYKSLNKPTDIIQLFIDNTKLVINIQALKLNDKKDSDNLTREQQIVLMYLLQNLIWYCRFQFYFAQNNAATVPAIPRNYIIIDELHYLSKDPIFARVYFAAVKVLRNYHSQVSGLSQSATDFNLTTIPWTNPLSVLMNVGIKIFFNPDNVKDYKWMVNEFLWTESSWTKEDKKKRDDLSNSMGKLDYFLKEYERLWHEYWRENEKKSEADKFRLILVEWFGNYYITIPQIWDTILKNLSKIKGSSS